MIELICPFCNKKLEPIGTSGQFQCGTWGCDASFNFIATRDVWEYIDRTRKALDVARNGLEYIFGYEGVPEYVVKHIRQVLDQIKNETALEQKDVK